LEKREEKEKAPVWAEWSFFSKEGKQEQSTVLNFQYVMK
jgi:hypothetical protein